MAQIHVMVKGVLVLCVCGSQVLSNSFKNITQFAKPDIMVHTKIFIIRPYRNSTKIPFH